MYEQETERLPPRNTSEVERKLREAILNPANRYQPKLNHQEIVSTKNKKTIQLKSKMLYNILKEENLYNVLYPSSPTPSLFLNKFFCLANILYSKLNLTSLFSRNFE